ncbi:hypothetical protein GGP41_003240 [Bipolaris sorokiniana]|uniref:Nucleoside phosphorylase domain-containing protein n=1 Tax=Cochliobolus sativus TaxID=45130 RepID=A0A8H5ZCX7_COCSA|nr:hypothetical protein GGP41_003240 [Bipolaris sorokiniana]
MPRQLCREDYTVGWVCALPIELAAAQEMLDEEHPDLKPDVSDNDENLYALGSIGGHNVVIACLPAGQIGTNLAAAVAMQMRATFKKIRFGLMVGIGGGVPSAEDVRLGDVVASQPHRTFAGVVQYGMGKKTPSGFERTGSLNAPPKILLAAIAQVQSNELRGKSKLSEYVAKLERIARFQRSKAGPDVLFEAAYDHEADDYRAGQTCDGCDLSRQITRHTRESTNEIVVHYGTIASGNQVMRSAIERDKVSKELGGVLCFEMEAAGLMNSFPCLVVRGICDYADSHKNKRWQPYAAATAAAYAKEVLLVIPPAEVAELHTAGEATQFIHKHNSERSPSPIAKGRKVEGAEDLETDTVDRQKSILASISQMKQMMSGTHEQTHDITASEQLSSQQQNCLRSLSFPEQEHRFHDIHTAVDTCEWLFEHEGYQAWMKGHSGLFWIKGDPGAGKSVLMKHCVKRMRERSPDSLVVSFFFHGQGKPLQKTLSGLFRALLSSMLEHFPENLAHLAAKCTEKEKRYGRDAWEWTENELKEAFSNILLEATHRQCVAIFIDALDECGEDSAKSLLVYFRDLTYQAKSKHARFRVCLSSRHYPILALDTISSVKVEKMNGQDIRWYVRERLKDITPEPKREQIQAEILSKSNGGFQWVFLVTRGIVDKNLTGTKSEKLLEEIATCPKTLSKMYETILNGVPAANQHQMAKIFQWVLFAERPLSAQELQDALAADKDMSYRTARELRTHESWSDTLADFERYVKHISRGLICFQSREIWEQYELNGPDSDREAQLIHQSVADFLIEEFASIFGNHLPADQSLMGSSQLQISRSCLRYMIFEDILEDATLPRGAISSKYPLAPYAVRFLFMHIKKVEQEGIPQSDLLSVMQWTPDSEITRKLATLWRTLDPNSVHMPLGWPFVRATALHVSVAFGSMSAVNILLESGFKEFESRDADGNTPLMLATREGHQDIASALLDRIVDCEGQHGQHDPDVECGVTPLSVACATVINAQNSDDETALDFALGYNMSGVIEKIIGVGANLNYLGREAALVAHAISSRNTELLSTLIEKKLKLDGAVFFALKDMLLQRDPVLEGIIFQLLSAGANTARSLELTDFPERRYPDDDDLEFENNGNYDTDALALASRRGLTDMVEMLLQHGAPAALQNDLGQCPILIATENGHEEVVKILLSSAPSSVETKNMKGDTALSIAAQNGMPGIIELLLQEERLSASKPLLENYFVDFARNGASIAIGIILQRKLVDPDLQDESGRTPLSWAARNGHKEVVKQLLDTGRVDPDAKDKDGLTPLWWAAYSDAHEAVVKQLLDTGKLLDTDKVNINAKDKDGLTPLWWAAHNRHEAVVDQLLDAWMAKAFISK